MSISRKTLEDYATMERSPMETIEDNEILRLVENGYKIVTSKVDSESISVDYPQDLDYVTKKMIDDKIFRMYMT